MEGSPGLRAAAMPWYKPRVGNLYAIVAFTLLWLFLLSFFVGLVRWLVGQRRRSRDEGRRWEHGL